MTASRITPHLQSTIRAIEDPDDPGRGVLLVTVERSPLAPHALLDADKSGALRYPIRDGATTRWMGEAEVATAYRARFTVLRDLAARLDTVENEALATYGQRNPPDPGQPLGRPLITVTLVPDRPGQMPINREHFNAFQQVVVTESPVIGSQAYLQQAYVGPRRYSAQAGGWFYSELHADGAGSVVMPFAPVAPGQQIPVYVEDTTRMIMSGLLHLARHARDRAAASGIASLRCRIIGSHSSTEALPLLAVRENTLTRQAMPYGPVSPTSATGVANALLDDLADGGASLLSAVAVLVNDLFQSFGVAEVPLITLDGQIRPTEWGTLRPAITAWAASAGAACITG
jgi:hypothetical protein